MPCKSCVFLSLMLLLALIFAGCAPAATPAAAPTAALATQQAAEPTAVERNGANEVILATTTSTRDSGLLDLLLPIFEKQSGFTVKMIAVGSGQAMKMGEMGNADVLLVHSPKAEKEYMEKGFGTERLLVMHNDFIVLGSAADPAKIKGITSPAEAFKKIADAKADFISRGDKSGTHSAELAIWTKAGFTPSDSDAWYLQTGQGMGDTLRIASEKGAYTLSDRATYLAQKDKLELEILVEGDVTLFNIYHVITVNAEKFANLNAKGGKAFADFMVSADTQKLIGEFGANKFGQPLFFPDAGKQEGEIGK